MSWLPHPFQGDYKHFPQTNNNDPADEYDVMSLAKRLGITRDEMLDMSFVSLFNILISSTNNEEKEKTATQEDIDRMFGR